MKSVELQDKLNIELGKYFLNIPIYIKSVHKQHFLNNAINEVFNKYYENFKEGGKVRSKLASLIKKVEITASNPDTSVDTNGIFFKLPEKVYHTIEEYIKYDGRFIPLKAIDYGYYNVNINNTRRKPYKNLFWRLDMGDGDTTTKSTIREIIHDGSVTDLNLFTYHILYIKRPEAVDIKNNTFVDLGYKPLKEAISLAANMIYNYYTPNKQETNSNQN